MSDWTPSAEQVQSAIDLWVPGKCPVTRDHIAGILAGVGPVIYEQGRRDALNETAEFAYEQGRRDGLDDAATALDKSDIHDVTTAVYWLRLLATEGGDARREPVAGDRIVDGGEPGVMVRCPECGGSGLLHKPDHFPALVIPPTRKSVGGSGDA